MKILHIITHYHPIVYGAENFAKHLAEYQVNKGNTVHVLTGRWERSWLKNEKINGVTVYRVSIVNIRFIKTILAIFPLFFSAFKLCKKEEVNVVHTHIYPGMLVGWLLKKTLNITFIATIQGGDIGDYPEVFGPFSSMAKSIIGVCLKSADKVHCVSTYLSSEVEKMGVSTEKIILIPNGVDINKFRINKAKLINGKGIRLVSTSRLEGKNNLIQLIKSISELRNRDLNVSLDIYGTGSQIEFLTKLIEDLKLNETVKLKGYINQNRLPETLLSYDFFIRLSKQEGFGISFIEAMACGLVPIGTKVGGITDIITDKVNGFYVSLDRNIPDQLSNIFSLKDNELVRKNAIKTAREKFDWNTILKKTVKLYD